MRRLRTTNPASKINYNENIEFNPITEGMKDNKI
jgi:hypothetical protein